MLQGYWFILVILNQIPPFWGFFLFKGWLFLRGEVYECILTY